ncbi:MAG: hypothetical protein KY464_13020, partial [Gemmatimonadetes bacterium]|nr:hypothetical protein [Gemmatimonadota bacterium]
MKIGKGWTEDRLPVLRRLALITAVPLALSACTDTDVENAGAQNAAAEGGAAAADSTAAPGAPGPAVASKFGTTAAAATQCMKTLQDRITTAAAAEKADSAAKRPPAGHSAVFAAENGWYPQMPPFAEGSILPCGRIVAYYGHPKSKRMGALGEFPKEEMLRRFKNQVKAWETADPSTPVIPALHMVSVVAQGEAGTSGKYRTITGDSVVERMYSWAKEAGAIFIVDIQVGQDDIRNILPRFDWILKNPDVHI